MAYLLNRKFEEPLAHRWQEWSPQAAELQVFRVDAENQEGGGFQEWSAQAVKLQVFRADTENQEEGGFYKMDENSIQILREEHTKEFQALAESHTTAIEQLLEEFNDDQMLLRLEAKAYEQD